MNTQSKSVWGAWWTPIRKWFYPLWLAYETLFRFYEYADSVYHYFYELGKPTLASFCSISAFAICAACLTLPACFVLYKLFDTTNLTGSQVEVKLKPYF